MNIEPKELSTEDCCIGLAFWTSLVAGVLLSLTATGCSFKVETGWHGRTGRDDRVQTQLVNTEGRGGAIHDAREKY